MNLSRLLKTSFHQFLELSTKLRLIAATITAVAVLGIYGLGEPSGYVWRAEPGLPTADLARISSEWGFNDRGGVPRVFLSTLPGGMGDLTVSERKKLFITAVLPLVLRENDRIRAQRARVVGIAQRRLSGLPVPVADGAWLRGLARKYRTTPANMDELLRRIDTVPPSLAIAQSAEETGWGTSRFVREGNALFGQWTLTRGAGLVPIERRDGETHEVKAYGALAGSVRDYMWNLNAHPAYRDLRQIRADLRDAGHPPGGKKLSAALANYSARGADYIRSLRVIMRVNGLEILDRAQLEDQRIAALDIAR